MKQIPTSIINLAHSLVIKRMLTKMGYFESKIRDTNYFA